MVRMSDKSTAAPRTLPEGISREEAKFLTRRRLLDGALRLLAREGFAEITASRIAREAGIAQSSFYVHFANKDDLVRSLADELTAQLRRTLRDMRRVFVQEASQARMRDAYRAALEGLAARPELYRLFIQEMYQPASPVGEYFRELKEDFRRDLVEDMAAVGEGARTVDAQRRIEMVADGIIALTETFALGYIAGRYRSLDDVIDILVAFTVGPAQYLVAPK